MLLIADERAWAQVRPVRPVQPSSQTPALVVIWFSDIHSGTHADEIQSDGQLDAAETAHLTAFEQLL